MGTKRKMLIAQLSAWLALILCEIPFSQMLNLFTFQQSQVFSYYLSFFFFFSVVGQLFSAAFPAIRRVKSNAYTAKVGNKSWQLLKLCFCFSYSYYFNQIQKTSRLNYYLYGLTILQWVQILAQSLKIKNHLNNGYLKEYLKEWLFYIV